MEETNGRRKFCNCLVMASYRKSNYDEFSWFNSGQPNKKSHMMIVVKTGLTVDPGGRKPFVFDMDTFSSVFNAFRNVLLPSSHVLTPSHQMLCATNHILLKGAVRLQVDS